MGSTVNSELIALIRNEGWEIILDPKTKKPSIKASNIIIPGLHHPFAIYSKFCREETNPELKYMHLLKMHDLMWPGDVRTWTYWEERRFRAYCDGYNFISYAGGASTGKSYSAAKLGILFWLMDPGNRTLLVSSTTLESLNTRIFGYCTRLLAEKAVNVNYTFLRSKPPKVLFDPADHIHGIFAIAAKEGDEDRTIKDIIGRHPRKAMMVIVDEASDTPVSLLSALPNLQAGGIEFCLIAIANSKSRFDLHGSLSTPLAGWKSVDPLKDIKWQTTQKNGICLYFSPYESPAIHEKDPEKKRLLSKFYITSEDLLAKKKLYGEKSDSFYRFILGFWKDENTDDTVVSSKFLSEFGVRRLAEWSGIYPLQICAGLDPAFSTGGDQCILRLGILGQDVTGKILLDFRKEELLFRIKLQANSLKSAELQIADEVLRILNSYNCQLCNLAVDSSGQGRALTEVIKLRANSMYSPLKIYSIAFLGEKSKSFDVIVKPAITLWTDIRDFIQTDSLRGFDETTIAQLTSRLLITRHNKMALEPKGIYKARMGSISPNLAHSPDEADSLALCLQAAKIKFGFTPGQQRDIQKIESFDLEKWAARIYEAEAIEEKHSFSPIATFNTDIYSK